MDKRQKKAAVGLGPAVFDAQCQVDYMAEGLKVMRQLHGLVCCCFAVFT